MKKRILILAVVLAFTIVSIFGCFNVFADTVYIQRVAVKSYQPSVKNLMHDDDFNDVKINDTAASLDWNGDGRTVHSSYNASWIGSANGYKVSDTDTAVTVGLWNYIQLKNILDSDKLVVSFDMYNDAGEKLSFALMNKEHTASSSEWAVLLSMWGENNGGEIKFNGTRLTTLSAATVKALAGKWVNVTMIFERSLNSDGTGYEVSLTDFYLDGISYNTSSLEATSNIDWWTKTDYTNLKINARGLGTAYDNLIVYEPYDFTILNSSYDETENVVKITFTQGISESSLDNITLTSNGTKIECEKTLDSADTSQRTVLLMPTTRLDVANNSYIVYASNVLSFDKKETVSSSFTFGKKSIIAHADGYYTDDYPTGKYVFPKQNITGKVTLNNKTEEDKSVMMFSAYFENGLLKSIGDIDKRVASAGETLKMESTLKLSDSVEKKGELKTFVFESNLRPVMKAYGEAVLNTDSVKLYLVSDSICDDSYSLEKHRRGWGGFIGDYFGEEVMVVNHGHSGYTIENFMNGSGWKTHDSITCSWENIKNELSEGDVVMLSLGINDTSKINKGDYTWEYYQESIETIINDAREKGADVVLITNTPNIYAYNSSQDSFSNESHETAKQKMMETALENNVPCFDLNTALKSKLNELLENGWTYDNIAPAYTLDENNSKVYLKDDNNEYIPGVIYSDTTHYTREGSKIIAKLIADYLKNSRHDLISFMEESETPVSPKNTLLSDYSFENENAAIKAYAGGSWQYESDISRSGNKSVKFTKQNVWSALQIGLSDTYLLDLIKEKGAGRYNFEAYIRTGTYFLANDYTADIGIAFIDSNGEEVLDDIFEITLDIEKEIETKWTKVSMQINIDDLGKIADSNIAGIRLFVSAGNGKGSPDETQSFWVDDVVFEKIS